MFTKLTLALISTALFPFAASAAGLSITPARLDFAVTDGRQTSKNITVMNPTNDVMVFEVYADEFEDIVKVSPESFTLEAGTRKEVTVMVDPLKTGQSQTLATNLSVLGKALAESKVNVAAGAKLPIAITMTAESPPKSYAQNGIVIVTLLIMSLLLIRKLMDDDKPKGR